MRTFCSGVALAKTVTSSMSAPSSPSSRESSLDPGDDAAAVEDAQFDGDRLGGGRVVAGDHPNTDTGLGEGSGGDRCAGANNVQQAHKTLQRERRQIGGIGEPGARRCVGGRNCKHPKPAAPHRLDSILQHPVCLGVHRGLSAVTAPRTAHGQHHLRGPLHRNHVAATLAPDGGVEAASRLERQVLNTFPARIRIVEPSRSGRCDNGTIGGVGQLSIPVGRWGGPAGSGEHGQKRVTGRSDGFLVEPVGQVGDRDRPFGQGAGLVEPDLVHSAQRLDGAGVAHECVAIGETPCGCHLRQGGQGREAFGHCGDHQADAGTDRLTNWAPVQEPESGHRGTRSEGRRYGESGQASEPLLDA